MKNMMIIVSLCTNITACAMDIRVPLTVLGDAGTVYKYEDKNVLSFGADAYKGKQHIRAAFSKTRQSFDAELSTHEDGKERRIVKTKLRNARQEFESLQSLYLKQQNPVSAVSDNKEQTSSDKKSNKIYNRSTFGIDRNGKITLVKYPRK